MAYMPIEEEKMQMMDWFWEELNQVTERSKGIIYVWRDLNGVRVEVVGKHGENKRTNNGNRLMVTNGDQRFLPT